MEVMVVASINGQHSRLMAYDVVALDEQISVIGEKWRKMLTGNIKFRKEHERATKALLLRLEGFKAKFDKDTDTTEGESDPPKRPMQIAAAMPWGTSVYINTIFKEPNDVMLYVSSEMRGNVLMCARLPEGPVNEARKRAVQQH